MIVVSTVNCTSFISNPIYLSNQSYVQVEEVKEVLDPSASAATTRKPVKTLGAGPLLPLQGILGKLKKKQSTPNKEHLDAAREPSAATVLDDPTVSTLHEEGEEDSRGDGLANRDARQPSLAVDDGIVLSLQDAGEDNGSKVEAESALDDRVGTFKVRGIPFVYPFVQPRAWPRLIL